MTNIDTELMNLIPPYLISFSHWICSHSHIFEYSEAVSKGFGAYCSHFQKIDADSDAVADLDADSHCYHSHRAYCYEGNFVDSHKQGVLLD